MPSTSHPTHSFALLLPSAPLVLRFSAGEVFQPKDMEFPGGWPEIATDRRRRRDWLCGQFAMCPHREPAAGMAKLERIETLLDQSELLRSLQESGRN
jgi:hypothetical protein